MLQDILYAIRQLRKSPGFAMTAILTLALGIGATTAIFTLVHAVLLKSLPVTNPDELYQFGENPHFGVWGGYLQEGEFSVYSYDLYREFRDHTAGLSDVIAFQAGNTSLAVRRAGSHQAAAPYNGQLVTGNFFRTLGVKPWAGRLLNESDDWEGAAPAAVISFHTWQQKFGSDPSVVGSSYQLNGQPFTIVGVGAPGFFGATMRDANMPDFWMPVSMEPLLAGSGSRLKIPNSNWLQAIGRLKPGVDPKAVGAQLNVELHQWIESHKAEVDASDRDRIAQQKFTLAPGGAGISSMRAEYADGLKLLLVASGCVLLIACANLANLLLARGLNRRQELSVRMALGASRLRLIRKAVTESLLLGVFGGAAGVALAYAGTTMILHLAFRSKEFVPVDASPSPAVLLFALGMSLLTGVLFSLAPAWITTHAEPVEAMRGANRAMGANGPQAALPQKILVVAQVVVSVVLLSAAAMLAQSLHDLKHQNFGFETTDRYLVTIDAQQAGYKPGQLQTLFEQLQERLGQIPGVHGVGETLYAPMSNESWNDAVTIEGKTRLANMSVSWSRVEPGFFETIGTPILVGRGITPQDTASSRHVAVVNQTFVKKFFNGENPIGRHFGEDDQHAGAYEIVGVVADSHYLNSGIHEPARGMYFVPETQTIQYDSPNGISGEARSHYLENIVLWASASPSTLREEVSRAMADVDPNLIPQDMVSYDELLSLDFSQQNMIARLTSLFGGLALVLAAIGLYGVMSYAVEQRRGEIGIRMALGADRASVVRMVMRNAFAQIGLGVALGIPAAIAAGHAMSSQLFAVKPYSPLILGGAVLLLSAAALIAAAIPARRASSVEPMEALRAE